MSIRDPRVLTIGPGQPFLDILADAVLAGFPTGAAPSAFDLARWTILLPTRRAARELERIFLARSGGKALLLPRVAPIGDIDEDLAPGEDDSLDGLPDAMPRDGQILLLIDLIDQWARDNPHMGLAREIAVAPHQAHGLALSLAEFLDQIDTEDVDTARIPELYGMEAARHREAILALLGLARERYPSRLLEVNRVSAMARRAMVLRREAARLAEISSDAPVIAAGSTGSIPATRALLEAISRLPNGAVILPGLDLELDETSWGAVGPTHPQFALKQLLAALGVDRRAVQPMPGAANPSRAWLASEIMRPAETSDAWRQALAGSAPRMAEALAGVELIETRHVHEEATVIALILRQCLEQPAKTASLVTPDRNLARRVKAALARWHIAIDDSGGEPLIRSGGPALVALLLDAVLAGFSAATLAALLRHDLCRLGETPEAARRHATIIELALFRSGDPVPRLAQMAETLRRLWPAGDSNPFRHPVLNRIASTDWEACIAHTRRLVEALAPFEAEGGNGLAAQLDRLLAACAQLAGDDLWQGEPGEALGTVIDRLRSEAVHLAHCDFTRAAAILRHGLTVPVLRPPAGQRLRLSILGLLEARLIRPDLVVLGGLNEGTWPGLPDAGPWLNRPMRERLGMQQPERAIGQTAHDFVQAFGPAEVKLVWSRRLEDAPAIPSRWVLRLKMLLKASGAGEGLDNGWQRLARSLAEPLAVTPHGKPRPCPPAAARPRRLSVTRIERLIRDPYAIYARHILDLEPVGAIAVGSDPARRGTIFHNAIGGFLNAYPLNLPGDPQAELLDFGRLQFETYGGDPGILSFWWPRFQRIAAWLVQQEMTDRPRFSRCLAEVAGAMDLVVAGNAFRLTCRADRIDILRTGGARVVDYKTGTVPTKPQVESGLMPQLTLTAAILAAGGFREAGPLAAETLAYVKLGGGNPPGEVKALDFDDPLSDIVQRHTAGLVRLLTAYADPLRPYLPRTAMEKEDDPGDYDHLSRFREWALAGTQR